MHIKWKIQKRSGHFRPVLAYQIALEDFEKDLALPAVKVDSDIAKIPNAHERFCLPDTNERDRTWQAEQYHKLASPDFHRAILQKQIILPYTCSQEFQEIETSFAKLRSAFEEALLAAYASSSFSIRKEMGLTSETRTQMATGIAASRMLNLFAT